jgi:endonuclease/exonuclease/phosphatase family metal-dependent hydrolase
MALKFISVNVERDRHLDKIKNLLIESNADFVCLQEVMQYEVSELAKTQNYFSFFSPTTRHQPGDDKWEGIAVLSRYPLRVTNVHQYAGPERPGLYDKSTTETLQKTRRYLLQVCEIESDQKRYRFANTHFTWSRDGQADDYQRQDVKKMLEFLQGYKSLVLSGDFNAPRGREIFSTIAEQYKDNIPADYQTSLDENLHRCGYLPYVVDGLFSTPEYKVTNVELVFGVSDHAAVRAEVDIN